MFGASLISAIFARDIRPIDRASESIHRLWDVQGPLTAFEAYDIAERLAMRMDVDAVCTSIASEGPIEMSGRASAWMITFHLPVRRACATYRVCALAWEDGEARSGIEIDESVEPIDASAAALDSHPLPVPFRDSSEVMRLIDAGLHDSQAASISLRSARDEQGRFVWTIDGLPIEQGRTIPLAA